MRLTAILCNYNHAAYLPQAITAMVTSQRPPDELIIVDDGSTDDSRPIIETFAAQHASIRVIWHEKNQGWHAGMAHALEIATGDWIYSGAADDYVLPGFFSRAAEIVQQWPDAGIVCGAFRRILPDGVLIRRDELRGYPTPAWITPEQFRREPQCVWNSLSPAAIYARKSIELAGGFRRELGYWSDTFVIRVGGHRWGMAYFPEECMCFREMPAGMSGSGGRNTERIRDIVIHADRLMRSPEFASVFSPAEVDWWWQQIEPVLKGYLQAHVATQMDLALAPIIDLLLNPPNDSSGITRRLYWLCRKTLAAAYRPARWLVSHTRAKSTWMGILAERATGS